jgi:hypothetical protein
MGAFTSFRTLLDEMAPERSSPPAGVPPMPSVDYLQALDALHSGRISVTPEAAVAEYLLSLLDEAVIVPAAAPALSVEPAEIARELRLTGLEKPAELDRIRRAFAFRNHPDRVPPELRENAMARMQIANQLIDSAKAATARRG